MKIQPRPKSNVNKVNRQDSNQMQFWMKKVNLLNNPQNTAITNAERIKAFEKN